MTGTSNLKIKCAFVVNHDKEKLLVTCIQNYFDSDIFMMESTSKFIFWVWNFKQFVSRLFSGQLCENVFRVWKHYYIFIVDVNNAPQTSKKNYYSLQEHRIHIYFNQRSSICDIPYVQSKGKKKITTSNNIIVWTK